MTDLPTLIFIDENHLSPFLSTMLGKLSPQLKMLGYDNFYAELPSGKSATEIHKMCSDSIKDDEQTKERLPHLVNEILDYLQRKFNLDRQVAAGSYGILKRVYSMDGDIEEALLKSVIERMKKDSKITEEVPIDRIVDLSLVREVQSELKSKGRK